MGTNMVMSVLSVLSPTARSARSVEWAGADSTGELRTGMERGESDYLNKTNIAKALLRVIVRCDLCPVL